MPQDDDAALSCVPRTATGAVDHAAVERHARALRQAALAAMFRSLAGSVARAVAAVTRRRGEEGTQCHT